MRNPTVCVAILALLLSAGTASAHHAFSRDFDQGKPVTLSGTVTKVEWTSPHVMTYIDVKDSSGKVTNWKIEMGNPAQLTKAGWTKDKLKAGEMISMNGWQAKSEEPGTCRTAGLLSPPDKSFRNSSVAFPVRSN